MSVVSTCGKPASVFDGAHQRLGCLGGAGLDELRRVDGRKALRCSGVVQQS
jgi:hypothetical protein